MLKNAEQTHSLECTNNMAENVNKDKALGLLGKVFVNKN